MLIYYMAKSQQEKQIRRGLNKKGMNSNNGSNFGNSINSENPKSGYGTKSM